MALSVESEAYSWRRCKELQARDAKVKNNSHHGGAPIQPAYRTTLCLSSNTLS